MPRKKRKKAVEVFKKEDQPVIELEVDVVRDVANKLLELPTFRTLTPQEQNYVLHYQNPTSETYGKQSKSYVAAGYKEHRGNAWRLHNRPQVQEALREFASVSLPSKLQSLNDLEAMYQGWKAMANAFKISKEEVVTLDKDGNTKIEVVEYLTYDYKEAIANGGAAGISEVIFSHDGKVRGVKLIDGAKIKDLIEKHRPEGLSIDLPVTLDSSVVDDNIFDRTQRLINESKKSKKLKKAS